VRGKKVLERDFASHFFFASYFRTGSKEWRTLLGRSPGAFPKTGRGMAKTPSLLCRASSWFVYGGQG